MKTYKEADIATISKNDDCTYTITSNKGVNGYTFFGIDWRKVPRFDNDGTQLTPEEFKDKVIEKYGALHFNQNYACEFLGSSHTLISAEKLQQMRAGEILRIRDNMLRVYSEPLEKHKYIMAVDPAKDGDDAFAVQIIDITDFNFRQVGAANLQVDYLLMPEFLNEWGISYNNAFIIIENNDGAGQSIADQLYQAYQYINIYFDTKVDSNSLNLVKSRKGYPGFRTTTKSRKQILQTLKLFIENDKLEINDEKTINEFYRFILNNGKFKADDGEKDDMIMALSLIFAPFCSVKNFDDMKKLVKNLYIDDDSLGEEDKAGYAELLTSLASFDDGSDEDLDKDLDYKEKNEYLNDFNVNYQNGMLFVK